MQLYKYYVKLHVKYPVIHTYQFETEPSYVKPTKSSETGLQSIT